MVKVDDIKHSEYNKEQRRKEDKLLMSTYTKRMLEHPEALALMLEIINCLKKRGVPISEIKSTIEQDTSLLLDDIDDFMSIIENIYESSKPISVRDYLMSVGLQSLKDLMSAIWKAIMLQNILWYQEHQLTYIGQDGRDYYGQEELTAANEVYRHQLYRKQ